MMHTTLNEIISYKKSWILSQQQKFPLHILKSKIHVSKRNFYKTLIKNKNKTKFIFEYKQASPSTGIIGKNFNFNQIINTYKNYATIISILTDEKFFHGNFNILLNASNIVKQPILCKDFFISEWQIYFARLYQADAILLILSILDDASYCKLVSIAHQLNMGVLTEISNIKELKRALSLGSKVIGINNRNLQDLSIDLNRTIYLSTKIPNSIITISESGITNYNHIHKLKRYVNGFLIGTALMSAHNQLHTAINRLILGENKICGITRSEDAKLIYKLGAAYGGLIFVYHSPRCININAAQKIISSAQNLNYVGVFCNTIISDIVDIVHELNLYAVQLHGAEDQNYINTLRKKIPITCHIWKGINMNQNILFPCNLLYIHRYILDNGGGTGKVFNWSYLANVKLQKSILAGGLTIHNCLQATKLGCKGLDFNSGVETQPGIKNHPKLTKIFQILRNYY